MVRCERCGACCQFIIIEFGPVKPDAEKMKLFELRGGTLKRHNKVWWVEMPSVCSKYDKETKLCKINSGKPPLCMSYPKDTPVCVLSDTCAFKKDAITRGWK